MKAVLNYILARLREPTTYIGVVMVCQALEQAFPGTVTYVHSVELLFGGLAMAVKEFEGVAAS